MRIVLDTDVMFAAFHSGGGASRQLLLELLDGKAHLLLSTTLLVEYEAVLTRPGNLAKFGIGEADVLAVLDDLAAIGTLVVIHNRWRTATADPDDVLVAAINGSADVIASFNLADMRVGAASFGIAVERPRDVLRRLRQ
ncbi:putative toxin-antitoxin system toxin component, PIN family [Azospirillum sp. RWY-5-1]|uniref:Toxin-antitoxin system toxin component, PIN family n=1 Tax=Azospirillum oleiclasticum TaxID=2735135 RepID=A0ABX2T531_9PROT|nr:putative toxin-antitoxin system toxin component, PIN family [Azospirillum oleiclasticum]NYZ12131.1 putative toxin-antitoxin system toxin component, PIN family [Azospirillum oleiclasticum]NYZ19291.1 putative toxin-antitoxin system toxin component, PIN family [Azospirillum oleiclasticum]